ncbi:MAG: hypothetical protein DDG60_02995 [Anaerolineae bacterium]|nr:MAG: hypothetical protein DDG60_02995 [Anaerolineae bacterium]
MKTHLKKLFLLFTLLSLVWLALPAQTVLAAGPQTPSTPSTPSPERAKARLEWAFANQKLAVERIRINLEYQDEFIAGIEERIAQAKEQGKDVSAVEQALAAYKQALVQAQPYYQQALALVQAQAGFDSNGKVTDLEKARQTVQALAESLKQYRQTLREPLQALREALKTLRPQKTEPSNP